MKVLALYDGMSCGQMALERAGIAASQYFASEIDRHAIFVTQKNYPRTIQLGDVRHVRQMAQFGLFGHIDLLIGGSPCQGFSFAGKQLAFDDPRSALFFEFVWTLQALRQVNPDIKFMLENVKMKKEHLDVITRILGVEPVCINSALVSAQNRVRYYWANWKISQPSDGGVKLRDILETTPIGEEYIVGQGQLNRLKTSTDLAKGFSKIDPEKAGCMTARQYANWKGNFVSLSSRQIKGIKDLDDKAECLTANGSRCGGNGTTFVPMTARHEKNVRGLDDKSQALLSTMHKGAQANGMTLVPVGGAIRGRYIEGDSVVAYPPKGAAFRRFGGNLEIRKDEKSNALLSDGHQSRFISDHVTYRKLTPVECERLQTVPDNYTAGVSDTQRYRMLGNGWTVDVIAHIFREMPR